MDFNNRQYDPQLGRFLSIDPLAAIGGQDMVSPYAAMGNTPESNVDPNGLMPTLALKLYEMARLRRIGTGEDDPRGGGASGDWSHALGDWAAGSNFDVWRDLGDFGGSTASRVEAARAFDKAVIDCNVMLSGTGYEAEVVYGGGGTSDGGDGKGKELTPSKKEIEKSDPSKTTSIYVYIWDNAPGGDKRDDLGHVAIRIGDLVYGYYPTTDIDYGSGQVKIKGIDYVMDNNKGEIITSYEVKVSPQMAIALTQSMNYSYKDPGNYSVLGLGRNCTSFAVEKLRGIGVNIYTNGGNIMRANWCTPNALNDALQYNINKSTFINRTRYRIGSERP